MRKKELILVHSTLFCIKRLFELAGTLKFEAYREFGVHPSHFHRTVEEHRKAVMLICAELLGLFCPQSVNDAAEVFDEIFNR